MRPRPQRHLVSEITSSILKVKRFESERFNELKYMYSYVIEIYHIIYILFISLNCMLLKQLPVVIRFNIHSKGPVLCTVVYEVSGYSILPGISFYFYFWCMTFHTLHEYLWDNWSRIIIINKILCSFLNLIW